MSIRDDDRTRIPPSQDDPPCPFYLEMFDPRFDNHLTLRSAVTRKRGLILTGYGPLPRGYRDPLLDNPTRHSQIHRSDTVVRGETLQRFNLRSTGDPTLLIIHRGIDKDNDSIVTVASIHLLYVRSRELEGRDLFVAPNSLDNWFISFINRVNQREKRSPCRTDDNGWILERDR